MNLHHPFNFDARGRVQLCATTNDHVRQMIEQVLFTNPGERVNRPEFGCGIMQTVFAPNSDPLAAALQVNIQASLQRWLGDVIELRDLNVSRNDSSLFVSVDYVVLRTGQEQTASFVRDSAL